MTLTIRQRHLPYRRRSINLNLNSTTNKKQAAFCGPLKTGDIIAEQYLSPFSSLLQLCLCSPSGVAEHCAKHLKKYTISNSYVLKEYFLSVLYSKTVTHHGS